MGWKMARQLNRLSARAVQTTKKPGRHSDGGGLYLVVDDSGAKRWVFMFRRGRLREMGIGSLTSVSLAEAREKSAGCRRVLAQGGDPIAERKGSRGKVPLFGEFADQFIEMRRASWRSEKHRSQWAMALRVHAAPLRRKPVDTIETEDVLRTLKPLWSTKHETASRLRSRIEMVLDAARVAGHRTGENPARWRGHLDHVLPRGLRKLTKRHHAAMPYRQVPAFLKALAERPAVSSLVLEFIFLTAARAGEATGATWGEIDLDEKVWTLPRERMKAFNEHRVPLSSRALAILAEAKQLHGVGKFVFPGRDPQKPPSTAGLEEALHRIEVGVTIHGFRSSFRDWAGDATHFPREVAEAALAHRTGDETEEAYRRSDALEKRRELMDAWARFCSGGSGGKVVQLADRREA
jgi:integrase